MNQKGQVLIGFIVFLIVFLPLTMGSISYMGKSLSSIDNYNKLDIVSISLMRNKCAVYNQMANINIKIIFLLRASGALKIIKTLVPESAVAVESILKIINLILKTLSNINLKLFNASNLFLKKTFIKLQKNNAVLILTESNIFKLHLRKMTGSELKRKIYYSPSSDYNVFIEENNFEKNLESNFILVKKEKNYFSSIFKKNKFSVSTRIKNGKMLRGGFVVQLI